MGSRGDTKASQMVIECAHQYDHQQSEGEPQFVHFDEAQNHSNVAQQKHGSPEQWVLSRMERDVPFGEGHGPKQENVNKSQKFKLQRDGGLQSVLQFQ